jgi:hypothetical protein
MIRSLGLDPLTPKQRDQLRGALDAAQYALEDDELLALATHPVKVGTLTLLNHVPVLLHWHPASADGITDRLRLLRAIGTPTVLLIGADAARQWGIHQ